MGQDSGCACPRRALHECVLSHFSSVQFFATPWTVARQAPLSMGFSSQEHWSGLPCPPPGDLPDLGIEAASLTSPAMAGRFFTTSAPWEALGGGKYREFSCTCTTTHPSTHTLCMIHSSNYILMTRFPGLSLLPTCCFITLCLSFPTCKMGITQHRPQHVTGRME